MKKILLFLGVVFLGPHVLSQTIFINEIDADTPGSDTEEFVELYSTTPSQSLDGYVLVFFNGSDDASYAAFDLDGYSTNNTGLFVLGNPGVTGTSINFNASVFQNGPDALALYQGDKSDFPNDTPATTANIVDAVAYGVNDPDDTALLTALGETIQYNEDENNDRENHSLQRQADGSFKTGSPTPIVSNLVLSAPFSQDPFYTIYPNPVTNTVYIQGLKGVATAHIFNIAGQRIVKQNVRNSLDVSLLTSGIYMLEITQGDKKASYKLIKQ
ncbi:MAG: T9SS type A sorting domain-containing protein [Flavobacteriaceae bacterium]|nr:T9SS type A sorting domain-containing protein [Flavobacteriaceae bacterium]